MPAGDDPAGAGAGAKRVQQDHLQIAAMDRELRMVVARRAPQRLLIDQLAEAVEERGVRGLDRGQLQRVFEAERGKLLDGMRKQIDADADRPDLGGGLEDAAGNFGLVQREPKRQSADPGADDDDLVHGFSRHAPQTASGGIQHDR